MTTVEGSGVFVDDGRHVIGISKRASQLLDMSRIQNWYYRFPHTDILLLLSENARLTLVPEWSHNLIIIIILLFSGPHIEP